MCCSLNQPSGLGMLPMGSVGIFIETSFAICCRSVALAQDGEVVERVEGNPYERPNSSH
jgi:hypothetical protein